MDYKKLISEGKSVREFKDKEIDVKYFDKVKSYIQESKKLIQDIDIEVKYFSKQQSYSVLREVAGYNGYIIKAPNYIVILSEVKNGYIENTGYIGEKVILKLRDLGIDSCWITINDSEKVKENLNIKSDKEVTAVIALGYEDSHQNKNSSSSSRLTVEEIVYLNKWEEKITIEELEERGVLEAFSYARLAPSTLNQQPWRFIIDNEKVILVVRKDEFTSDYERNIDAGIAMLYFNLIIDSTMFDSKWSVTSIDKEYNIPNDYEIAGYCTM